MGPISEQLQRVKVVQEARAVEAEIAGAIWSRGTLRVSRHEEAAGRGEEGLNDLRAGVADVEVVNEAS